MDGSNPYLEYGAFTVLVAIVLFTLKVLPVIVERALTHMDKTAIAFTEALKEQRDDFREERREERAFQHKEGEQTRASVGGLARSVERQTVAIVASSKGVDVDEALKTYEKRNGTERSGGTYAGAG